VRQESKKDFLMSDTYEALFSAIRAKCQRQHWYGPDCFNPKQYEDMLAYDPNFDKRTIEADLASADDPRRFGFVFPAASEEQLQETEAHIGFPLPLLLRAIYTNIANGGFGPGMGLYGVLNGYKGGYLNADSTIFEQHPEGTFDYATYQEHASQAVARGERSHMAVPYGQWLQHLLRLCDLGDCQEACVDEQEHMFMVAPLETNDEYGLFQLPQNLEEWLWHWVKDEQF
jgi:hypothetical protein